MTNVTATSNTRFATSADGTETAYDVTGPRAGNGPAVVVVGASSGAALVLEAARAGVQIGRIALYEAPFIVGDTHPPRDPLLGHRRQELVEAGRRGDAVKLFMRTVGVLAFGVLMTQAMPGGGS